MLPVLLAFALHRADPPAALDPIIDPLVAALRDPSDEPAKRERRYAAERALKAIGPPAFPRMFDAAVDPNPSVRAAAYSVLIHDFPQHRAEFDRLARARWDRSTAVERWLLTKYFFHKLPAAPNAAAVTAGLDSKDAEVRAEVWGYVVRNPKSDARGVAKEQYFRALAGDEVPAVRWGLLVREPVFDADREAGILIGLLKPGSWAADNTGRPMGCTPPPYHPDGRGVVADILGRRGVKKAVPALLALLAEKGPGRAYFADDIIPHLGPLGDPAAIPELKRVLAAPETIPGRHPTQAQAAVALWQLGDRTGRPLLLADLKTVGRPDAYAVRRFAAEAVARFGDASDRPVLAEMLDDEDWGVKQSASEGLERLTGVQNRDGRTRATESDAPLWKEWLKANPQTTKPR